MRLNGDHNQCAECGELFNSSASFDKHRTGAFGAPMGDGTYMMHSRRCLTVAEMQDKGMVKNAGGWWITAANPMNYTVQTAEPLPFGSELIG